MGLMVGLMYVTSMGGQLGVIGGVIYANVSGFDSNLPPIYPLTPALIVRLMGIFAKDA